EPVDLLDVAGVELQVLLDLGIGDAVEAFEVIERLLSVSFCLGCRHVLPLFVAKSRAAAAEHPRDESCYDLRSKLSARRRLIMSKRWLALGLAAAVLVFGAGPSV